MLDVTTTPLDTVLNSIFEAFRPKPIRCEVNGTPFTISKIAVGWVWSSPDGEQEDYEIEPFETAAQCQQSACWFAGEGGVV